MSAARAREEARAGPVPPQAGAAGAPRVLHVITTLDRGGAEKALLALCRARAERSGPQRLAVAFLKGGGELAGDFQAAGIEVRDFELRGLRAARAHSSFQRFRREFAPDVVHSHLFKADLLAASCLGRRRAGREALVSTKHNVDLYLEHVPWRALGRGAASRADAVVAISHGVARFVRETIGEPPAGIHVVPYGVEPPTVPTTSPPAAAGGVPTLLCVARFEPQKDHETLLDAFRLVLAARPARLVLLGRGAREAQVRAAAAKLPRGSVEFPAFAADPAPHYDAADVVVLASRWEGLGLALVEAALRARPVVATRVGGVPEVVEDGRTGLLVPPGDARALADGILRVLADPALARRLGETAASDARSRFDLDVCVDAHERIWRRVAGARA